MERNEISLHEVKAFLALRSASDWITSKDIAERAGIAPRTARLHALRLVRLGIVDQAEVFPAHRYRLASNARNRNVNYLQRLEQACEVFGLG